MVDSEISEIFFRIYKLYWSKNSKKIYDNLLEASVFRTVSNSSAVTFQ